MELVLIFVIRFGLPASALLHRIPHKEVLHICTLLPLCAVVLLNLEACPDCVGIVLDMMPNILVRCVYARCGTEKDGVENSAWRISRFQDMHTSARSTSSILPRSPPTFFQVDFVIVSHPEVDLFYLECTYRSMVLGDSLRTP